MDKKSNRPLSFYQATKLAVDALDVRRALLGPVTNKDFSDIQEAVRAYYTGKNKEFPMEYPAERIELIADTARGNKPANMVNASLLNSAILAPAFGGGNALLEYILNEDDNPHYWKALLKGLGLGGALGVGSGVWQGGKITDAYNAGIGAVLENLKNQERVNG